MWLRRTSWYRCIKAQEAPVYKNPGRTLEPELKGRDESALLTAKQNAIVSSGTIGKPLNRVCSFSAPSQAASSRQPAEARFYASLARTPGPLALQGMPLMQPSGPHLKQLSLDGWLSGFSAPKNHPRSSEKCRFLSCTPRESNKLFLGDSGNAKLQTFYCYEIFCERDN